MAWGDVAKISRDVIANSLFIDQIILRLIGQSNNFLCEYHQAQYLLYQ